MKQSLYHQINQNPLARQAHRDTLAFKTLTLVDFGSQENDASSSAISQEYIHDIPPHANLAISQFPYLETVYGQTSSSLVFDLVVGRTMTIGLSQPIEEEINPLARIAGSYSRDPNWTEFLQAIEASRQELEEVTELGE